MNFNDLSNNVGDEGRQHGGLHVKLCWKLGKINEALEAYTHKAYLTCDVSLSLCTPFTDTD